MILLWAALAATGLFLIAVGAPIGTKKLRRRIDPYLGAPRRPAPRDRRGRPIAEWQRSLVRTVTGHVAPSPDLRDRLISAGRNAEIDVFRLEQLSWGFAGALLAVLTAGLAEASRGGVDLRVVPLLAAILFVAGFLGRDWWLSREIERRGAALRTELPTAIDLITLSIMAGESVPAACARVGNILVGEMGAEFRHVTDDVRSGSTVVDALEDLARRVPEVGVARFVDAVVTGIEKGAPLAETLRAQADDGREARRRYLLEIGGRREVLMLVPVVFLVMPVVVVFALYPGLVTLELLVP